MKTISARISDQEHAFLLNLMERKGASLSDVLRGLIREAGDRSEVINSLRSLEDRVTAIAAEMDPTPALETILAALAAGQPERAYLNSVYTRIALDVLLSKSGLKDDVVKAFDAFKQQRGMEENHGA